MKIMKSFVGSILLLPFAASAVPISVIDFDSLDIGAKIVGPAGPDVEVSLINAAGESVGDLRSSVSCPQGFTECLPPANPVGTIYTYSHTLIPGLDLPNDAPFPNPGVVIDFDNVTEFALGFAATGFNGVAGYSFTEASIAGVEFTIDLSISGELIWQTTNLEWDSNEAITFFWQTTQAPSGPGGTYVISNDDGSAEGVGPIPTPLAEIDAPLTAPMLMFAGAWLLSRRIKQ